jgi:hypothetical protein
MNQKCLVVVPIYKAALEPLEEFSLSYSLEKLSSREVLFIVPAGLDLSFYQTRYAGVQVLRLPSEYFASIQGYNRLLLDPRFYEQFSSHEFLLILQTDAIVLQDELDHWCGLPYDYVGAPWPDPIEVPLQMDVFGGDMGKTVKTQVGNGGLSLRRNRKCMSLLHEFPEALQMFVKTGSSEDLFFALLGGQSLDFMIPNDRVAALFALEVRPEFYFNLNSQRAPMGGHAWWRQMPFWLPFLERKPPVILEAEPARRVQLNINRA